MSVPICFELVSALLQRFAQRFIEQFDVISVIGRGEAALFVNNGADFLGAQLLRIASFFQTVGSILFG
jgi:hypothetical protein